MPLRAQRGAKFFVFPLQIIKEFLKKVRVVRSVPPVEIVHGGRESLVFSLANPYTY